MAPARRHLAEIEHGREAAVLDPAALVADVLLVDLPAPKHHVVEAVEGEGVGREPVPAGPADLLVVALDPGRHVGMDDEAEVGLVDAHPEGDRRDHDHAVLLQERVLPAAAERGVETGMVGQRMMAPGRQAGREPLGAVPGGGIDDAARALAFSHEGLDPLRGPVLRLEAEREVRTVEAVDDDAGRVREQFARDVGAGRRIRGRREGQDLDGTEALPHAGQLTVFGPEVVAPLRDAMGLVDREPPDAGPSQTRAETARPEALRRDEEEAKGACI